MAKIGSYVQEAYDELVHKVSWPSWDELQQTTIIVLVALCLHGNAHHTSGMDFSLAERVLKLILYSLLGS